MAITAHNSALDLGGEYTLSAPAREIATTMKLPGDVHHALLAADLIPDPYFGENEKVVMWVNETAWSVERRFDAAASDIDGYLTLTLSEVDCIATIFLNGEEVARTDNSFVRNDIDVSGKVHAGENTLHIDFDIAPDVAKARADAHRGRSATAPPSSAPRSGCSRCSSSCRSSTRSPSRCRTCPPRCAAAPSWVSTTSPTCFRRASAT